MEFLIHKLCVGKLGSRVALGYIQGDHCVLCCATAGDLFCPSENSNDGWSAVKAGLVAERLCPVSTEGKMMRSCSATATWGDAQSNCTSQELLSGLHRAQVREGTQPLLQ